MTSIFQKAKEPQNIDKFVKYWFSTYLDSPKNDALFQFFKPRIYYRENSNSNKILGVFVEEEQFCDYLETENGKKGKSIFGDSLWTDGHIQENQWRSLFKNIAVERPRIFVEVKGIAF